VLGSARSPMSSEEFRNAMEEAVRAHARVEFKQEIWDELAASTYYVPTEFGDDHMHDLVTEKLTELDREHGTEGNRLFYLAVPPSAIPMLIREIGERRADDERALGLSQILAQELAEPTLPKRREHLSERVVDHGQLEVVDQDRDVGQPGRQ